MMLLVHVHTMHKYIHKFLSYLYRGDGRCKMFGVLMTFFGVVPSFDLEILGILKANILPILRNIVAL